MWWLRNSVWVGCVSSGVVVRFILLPSPDSVAPKALFSTFSNRERGQTKRIEKIRHQEGTEGEKG